MVIDKTTANMLIYKGVRLRKTETFRDLDRHETQKSIIEADNGFNLSQVRYCTMIIWRHCNSAAWQ